MIVRKEEAWVFDADDCTTLRRFIERAEVISLRTLAQFTGFVEEKIEQLLDNGELGAQIEWMRPLAAPARPETTFCRWRTPNDRQFTWEQNYFEGRRPAARGGNRTLPTQKDV
ncbi:MAG TPA: hypothetical protein PKE12_12980 [Kiritimatiellia bacterium]|nr:hypothetical protein [Kiritimatiellia bacterium]